MYVLQWACVYVFSFSLLYLSSLLFAFYFDFQHFYLYTKRLWVAHKQQHLLLNTLCIKMYNTFEKSPFGRRNSAAKQMRMNYRGKMHNRGGMAEVRIQHNEIELLEFDFIRVFISNSIRFSKSSKLMFALFEVFFSHWGCWRGGGDDDDTDAIETLNGVQI